MCPDHGRPMDGIIRRAAATTTAPSSISRSGDHSSDSSTRARNHKKNKKTRGAIYSNNTRCTIQKSACIPQNIHGVVATSPTPRRKSRTGLRYDINHRCTTRKKGGLGLLIAARRRRLFPGLPVPVFFQIPPHDVCDLPLHWIAGMLKCTNHTGLIFLRTVLV